MKTVLTFLLIVASLFVLFSGEAFATEPAAHGLPLKTRGDGPAQPAPLLALRAGGDERYVVIADPTPTR